MSSTANIAVPQTHEHPGQLPVLRSIATFELAKGLVVLLAAVGVVLLIQREDSWDIADSLLRLLHVSPDSHFAQIFLDWADTLSNARLYTIAGAAAGYSLLRFLEAYGLWHAKPWAEWIALISGAIYMPFEAYKLIHRVSWFHTGVLLINGAIVIYMVYVLKTGRSLHRIPG